MLRPRNCTGEFLSLSNLVGLLPPDYMITLYDNDKELWHGIAWVFIYDKVYTRYANYGVRKFDTDVYNENFLIYLYVRRKRNETVGHYKNVL